MDTLFNLDDYKHKSEYKCRDCSNVLGIEYESGLVFYYCKVTTDNKTHNKLKKIRLKDMACREVKLNETAN